MTKQELIGSVAELAGLSKTESEKALNAIIKSIVDAVKKGGEVKLVGFGTFKSVRRSARTCRNPQTGEEIKVDSSLSPKFKPGKAFKESLTNI
jgi:DNA-binding protein HU-beta